MPKKIIVIGSGAAGMSAASSAKRADPKAEVTVFTEDEHIAYSPCVIPWAIEGRTGWNDIIMHDAAFYKKERDIEVITKTSVTAVDGTDKTVTAGGKTYPYDSLVIATGGTVFIPPIEGKELKNVFVVRTINDGKAIQEALKTSKTVVIGGAGVIGLEMALSLKEMGKDVIVIEMMDQVIPRIADKDMADPIQEYLEGKGIKFVMKAPIQAVKGKDKVEGVTAAGTDYACDMVIFATGVRANLTIPKMLELDIGQLGAVAVAPTMQPYKRGRLVSDVFLAGDVVQCQSAVMPGPTMSQLGSTAVRQGMVAGANAAGENRITGPVASPWVSVIGDMHIAGTGLSLGLASWYGIKTVEGKAEGLTRARYYPGGKPLTVKVIADAFSHRIIGAQIIAGEDATGRIDWLTSAIIEGVTAEDFAYRSENAYCPPTSMVRDVVLMAVDDLCSKF
ncbi:MAG: FAD-dependent oxidoreductase [Candidatus Methanomethylophilaceae archaeon]|nr:FAD-dependent oxidoreductase [Candidatus Methanomethylophilaceae archaeon]